MKQIDTLIIAGASITSSPWLTWADVVTEILKPKKIINISARGTGNYYIALSCINSILNSKLHKNTLCMPMFTCIDKFDMYLDQQQTKIFTNEKHTPINLTGQPAAGSEFSFWSTGSHWPLVKQQYFDNFFNTDIACANNMLIFYALEKLCADKGVEFLPLFDMEIWNYTEKDMNEYFILNKPLERKNLLEQPLSKNIKMMLPDHWFNFTSLIGYAMENDLPVYNDINKLHPPSDVHVKWVLDYLNPLLEQQFKCYPLKEYFIKMIENFSQVWKDIK